MKQGKNLNDLAAELSRQMETKKDYVAPTSALQMVTNGDLKLQVGEVGKFQLSKNAHDQIGQRLGIPAKYYDRMIEEAPELLAVNVNHWLAGANEKRMVRTLDGKARAFLSDRFRPLDNYDLAEAVLPKLIDMDCRIESCELTERRLYIKAVCPKIEGSVSPNVGDIVQAGVSVSNSEIGCGSLLVEPFVFKLSCRNGAISADYSMRKYHVGKRGGEIDFAQEFYRNETRVADDKAFWMKVQDLVAGTLSRSGFDRIIEGYKRAQKIQIDADPVKVVEVFAERNQLFENERGGILKHLVGGGDLSLYGLMNAVTRFAQDVDDYDRATDLERLGGAVAEMSEKEVAVLCGKN